VGRYLTGWASCIVILACLAVPGGSLAAAAGAGHALELEPAGPAIDLNLEQAINRALKANRTLLDAGDRVAFGELSLQRAKSQFELKIFPAVQAGLSGGGDDQSDLISVGLAFEKKFSYGSLVRVEPGVERLDDSLSLGVRASLTQPLLRGLNQEYNLAPIHQAEYEDRRYRRNLHLVRINVVLDTIRRCYEVVRQREMLRLNSESVARLTGFAEAAKAKERIGLASPLDTYRAMIQLRSAQDAYEATREALGRARDNLSILLAYPLDRPVEVQAPLSYDLIPLDLDEQIDIALKNRSELGQAQDDILDAQRRSRIDRHRTLPDIKLSLTFNNFGPLDGSTRDSFLEQSRWGIGLFSETDLRRTSEKAEYQQSLLNLKITRRARTTLEDEIFRQVKSAALNLRRSEKAIDLQRAQIEEAKAGLALARAKFKWGRGSNFDLIQAESDLRRAELSLVSAVIDYIVGGYSLRAAMGTLIDQPG